MKYYRPSLHAPTFGEAEKKLEAWLRSEGIKAPSDEERGEFMRDYLREVGRRKKEQRDMEEFFSVNQCPTEDESRIRDCWRADAMSADDCRRQVMDVRSAARQSFRS